MGAPDSPKEPLKVCRMYARFGTNGYSSSSISKPVSLNIYANMTTQMKKNNKKYLISNILLLINYTCSPNLGMHFNHDCNWQNERNRMVTWHSLLPYNEKKQSGCYFKFSKYVVILDWVKIGISVGLSLISPGIDGIKSNFICICFILFM